MPQSCQCRRADSVGAQLAVDPPSADAQCNALLAAVIKAVVQGGGSICAMVVGFWLVSTAVAAAGIGDGGTRLPSPLAPEMSKCIELRIHMPDESDAACPACYYCF